MVLHVYQREYLAPSWIILGALPICMGSIDDKTTGCGVNNNDGIYDRNEG